MQCFIILKTYLQSIAKRPRPLGVAAFFCRFRIFLASLCARPFQVYFQRPSHAEMRQLFPGWYYCGIVRGSARIHLVFTRSQSDK